MSENIDTRALGAQSVQRRDLNQAMRRGALGTCPNCGKGALFRAYLKQVDVCEGCGEELSHIRADDGPAWLTVLIVGHLVVFLAMIVDAGATWSVWWSVGMFSALSLVLVLLLLQPAKGIFIGAIWASRLSRPDQL